MRPLKVIAKLLLGIVGAPLILVALLIGFSACMFYEAGCDIWRMITKQPSPYKGLKR